MFIFHNTQHLPGFTVTMTLVLMTTHSLQAQSCYSQCDGDFTDPKIWNTKRDGTGYSCTPGDAIIQPGDTVHVDSTTDVVCSVTIEDDTRRAGVLEMRPSGVLQIDDAIEVEDALASAGAFKFVGTSGTPGEVRATSTNVTLSGLFQVTGTVGAKFGFGLNSDSFDLQSDGTITSASGQVTITAIMANSGVIDATGSDISIIGSFTNNLDAILTATGGLVTVSGTIENDGLALVNGGNMTFSGQLDTGSTGMFRLSSNHTMTFKDGSEVTGNLAAHFDVQSGTLRFSGTHSTTGGCKQTGGTVQVDAYESFEATGAFLSTAGTTP